MGAEVHGIHLLFGCKVAEEVILLVLGAIEIRALSSGSSYSGCCSFEWLVLVCLGCVKAFYASKDMCVGALLLPQHCR